MHSPSRRRFAVQLAGAALAAGAAPAFAHFEEASWREGKVFTSTNSTELNELLVYAPSRDGGLVPVARAATNGQGSGAGLGSQGAVTLSGDGRHVFVVNARSNTVATFTLHAHGITLSSVVDSGGLTPTSVAEHEGLVYVLNAGGSGNVAGFRNQRGQLVPLHDGQRALSAAGGTNPAQVGFGADGAWLVVTERATNRITGWSVRGNGTLGAVSVAASSGAVPFGFAVDRRDHLIVCEAAGSAASSYRIDERSAAATPISASVPNGQAAACWLVVTPDGRHAYTANAGTSNLSSYRIARDGRLTLLQAVAASNGANAGATDLAATADGRFLYALAPRGLLILAYRIAHDGSLTPLGAGSGLPAGTVGLAAN